METTMTKNPLGYEKLPKLLRGFAIPSIIAMLVSSLYNIVDQIFIGQGVGYLGNAATNVAFPLTSICLAIALLIGIGSASNFSLSLGAGDQEKASRVTGNAICMMFVFGILYAILIEIFLSPMLTAFGATTEIMPYAQSYTRITAIGMPLLIITNGLSTLARADGSPKYSMICMIVGAVINTILDPIFTFVFDMGIAGAAWATIIGQFVSFLFAVRYIGKFKSVHLKREHFRLNGRLCAVTASLGMSNSLNQLALCLVQIVMNNSLTYYDPSVYGAEIPLAACGTEDQRYPVIDYYRYFPGLQPIVGFNYGARKYDRVRGIYKLAIGCNLIISAVGFILFQFFPHQIISIFGTGDAAYFEFAVKLVRVFLFMVIVNGVQLISSNFFAAIGKPVKGMVLSLTRQVFFLIPLILILPLFMGIDGLMFAAPIANTIAFLTTILLITKELRSMKRLEQEENTVSSQILKAASTNTNA